MQNNILKWHNDHRNNVANGVAQAKDGKTPKASDMMELTWDDELAATAQL